MTTVTSGALARFSPDSALARAPEIAQESAVFREVLTEIGRVIVGQRSCLMSSQFSEALARPVRRDFLHVFAGIVQC